MLEEALSRAELVTIGRIARAQGRAGEVVVNPLTDVPDRFVGLARIYLDDGQGEPSAVNVEGVRMHKGRPVLKLEGISSIGQAESLAGHEVRIPESELSSLPEGSFYHFEILGSSVEDVDRGEIGIVEAIVETGGTDILVVRSHDGREELVPLCAEICRSIDPVSGRIVVELPEGLIGLNAN